MKNNQWLTYEEAKRVVQPLGLKSQKEWQNINLTFFPQITRIVVKPIVFGWCH
jgi:hypothetical protein